MLKPVEMEPREMELLASFVEEKVPEFLREEMDIHLGLKVMLLVQKHSPQHLKIRQLSHLMSQSLLVEKTYL